MYWLYLPTHPLWNLIHALDSLYLLTKPPSRGMVRPVLAGSSFDLVVVPGAISNGRSPIADLTVMNIGKEAASKRDATANAGLLSAVCDQVPVLCFLLKQVCISKYDCVVKSIAHPT